MLGFWTGAVLGGSTKVLQNALRRQRLMHEPWEHLICAGIGAFAGAKYAEFVGNAEKREDTLLSMRGPRTVVAAAAADADE